MDDEQALFDEYGRPRRMLYRQYYVRTPQNELQCWVSMSALPPVPTSSLPLPADEVATAWSPWSPSAEDDQSTAAGGAAAGGAPAAAPAAAPIADLLADMARFSSILEAPEVALFLNCNEVVDWNGVLWKITPDRLPRMLERASRQGIVIDNDYY